jgi:hypothetical protein
VDGDRRGRPVAGHLPRAGAHRAQRAELLGRRPRRRARAHQGIDIFAPRGTPAVAATDGVVRRVGENRLGGRVVFLYDPEGGQSLYYAHLDSQTVADGQRVRAGDTLGFVGNTGNARTTAPHLHFGIYRGGEGAVNPFPFVDDQVPRAPALAARDSAAPGRRARTASAAPLRSGPSARAATLARVAAATPSPSRAPPPWSARRRGCACGSPTAWPATSRLGGARRELARRLRRARAPALRRRAEPLA